jgi:hypothetical protein
VNACAHEGKQFLFLIRHPPCYSFIESKSPIKVLSVIEERKHLRTKEKINFHPVSCVSNVAGVSGVSILDRPFGFL